MEIHRTEPSSHAWWSAAEVLTWIAFRTASTAEDLYSKDFVFRWKTSDGASLLAVLQALAGEGVDGEPAAPCCPLATEVLGGARNAQMIAERLAADRQQTPSDMARDLEADLAGARSWSEGIARARGELAEEIRAGRISAWGRPTEGVGNPRPGSRHEQIDPVLFLRPIQVEVWDSIQPDTKHPHFWTEAWDGYTFADVRFKRAEILSRWPVSMSESDGSDAASAPEQAERSALSRAYWNAAMCLAWIASRDENLTASLQAEQNGRRLGVRLAWRLAELEGKGMMELAQAERELLGALQAGHIQAQGTFGAGRGAIGAEVACLPDARFREDAWDRIVLETRSSLHSELLFPRDAIVGLWPPRRSMANQEPVAGDEHGKASLSLAPSWRHRPPTQRQQAVEVMKVLYGCNGPPRMKREALLAEVNQRLAANGESTISRKTLVRALQYLGQK